MSQENSIDVEVSEEDLNICYAKYLCNDKNLNLYQQDCGHKTFISESLENDIKKQWYEYKCIGCKRVIYIETPKQTSMIDILSNLITIKELATRMAADARDCTINCCYSFNNIETDKEWKSIFEGFYENQNIFSEDIKKFRRVCSIFRDRIDEKIEKLKKEITGDK
jgi:hypothetical protein